MADGGLIDTYITAEELAASGLKVAADASAAVLNIFSGLTRAQVARMVMWLVVFDVVVTILEDNRISGSNTRPSVFGKINIPKLGFASPSATEQPNCSGTEEVDINSVSSSTTDDEKGRVLIGFSI